MGISLSDLSPKMREQVMAKVKVEEARRREPKYHAQKVQSCLEDGTPFTFASVKEADRYHSLALLQRCGEISDLKVQVSFDLIPSQKLSTGKTERGMKYVADFVYTKNGKTVVEDVKGYRDPASAAYRVFTIKRKLMKFFHNIEVAEV